MKPHQSARFRDPLRRPFQLFETVEQELTVATDFWRNRMPQERLEYLEFMRRIVFGEESIKSPVARCYGWRKLTETEPAPENTIYF